MPDINAPFYVDFSSLEKFGAKALGPQQVESIMQQGDLLVSEALIYLHAQIVGRAQKHSNTGELADSFEQETTREGMTVVGTVGSSLPYGMVVEKGGTWEKWPPRDVIKAWVVRKFGLDPESKEADSAAFLVQRAIGKGTTKGIMRPYDSGGGARMVEKGYEAAKGDIERVMEKILVYLEVLWGQD